MGHNPRLEKHCYKPRPFQHCIWLKDMVAANHKPLCVGCGAAETSSLSRAILHVHWLSQGQAQARGTIEWLRYASLCRGPTLWPCHWQVGHSGLIKKDQDWAFYWLGLGRLNAFYVNESDWTMITFKLSVLPLKPEQGRQLSLHGPRCVNWPSIFPLQSGFCFDSFFPPLKTSCL